MISAEPTSHALRTASGARLRLLRLLRSADLVAALVLAALALALLARPIESRRAVAIGAGDLALARGFHPAEFSAAGRLFRWTDGRALLRMPAQAAGAHVLTLDLAAPQLPGSATLPASLSVDGAPLAELALGSAARSYRLLLPPPSLRAGESAVAIESATFRSPGDARELGVAIFGAELAATEGAGWLPPLQAAALGLAALLLGLALRGAGLRAERLAAAALFVAVSLSMRHSDLRFAERWWATLLSLGLAGALALAHWDDSTGGIASNAAIVGGSLLALSAAYDLARTPAAVGERARARAALAVRPDGMLAVQVTF